MRNYLVLLSLCLFSSNSIAEEFESVCKDNGKTSSHVSLFHCGKNELPNSIKKLMKLNEGIGKKHCRQYAMESRRNKKKDSELELLIFDQKRKTSRPLKCYCQEKLGKGLCENEESFNKKMSHLSEPFQTKAWGVFLKDFFSQSVRGGESCVQKVEDSINDNGCLGSLDKVHKRAKSKLNLPGRDGEVLKSKDLKGLFTNLKERLKTEEGKSIESRSGYFKSRSVNLFLNKYADKKVENIMGLSTSLYEKKLKQEGLIKYIDTFGEVIRSPDPERALRENFKGGISFFESAEMDDNPDAKISVGSHPDLRWLFTGIESFNSTDRRYRRDVFLKFSSIAKENPFLNFKELKSKYDEKYGPVCDELVKKIDLICKMDGSKNLSISKEIIQNKEFEKIVGYSQAETSNNYNQLASIREEISCFQFPENYENEPSLFSDLVERTIDKKDMLGARGVSIPAVQAKVESAINKVEGFEKIAERIGKGKVQGEELEKYEALEEDFKGFLGGLTLPDGRSFSYPEGMDPAQAVANYKSEVYRWADDAVEKRISDIQGETDRIVNSDLSPKEKKEKLQKLLGEVDRLNKGDFLEEIYKEKQNIGEYIARYEDKKRDWEAQYGDEAKASPEAVQAVAPPRSKTKSAGKSGANSYKNIAGNAASFSDVSASAPVSSSGNSAAYIPAAPSVPFAQGSLMTRIVPKDEFQSNTVKASLLARHKGYPIAVLDEKSQKVELYTPKDGTSYKLQETLTISEAEARGYVFPEDVKRLVEGYKKDKLKGRAPASFVDYEPTKIELLEKKKKLEKLQSLSDVMERQGVPRRARVVRLNSILDNI